MVLPCPENAFSVLCARTWALRSPTQQLASVVRGALFKCIVCNRFQSAGAPWLSGWRDYDMVEAETTWERQDLCLEMATQGLAQLLHVRPAAGRAGASDWVSYQNNEFHMIFVLAGELLLVVKDQEQTAAAADDDAVPHRLYAGDTVVLPPALTHKLQAVGPELRLLECFLPASHRQNARI
jgi:mannose-6-phosphate isomerase-like protein (cupin superfamily)